MEPGNILYQQIVDDTDNFSLKGMVKPVLYNFGKDTVHILHAPIPPGGSFDAGAEGVIMQNGIPIRFEGEDKSTRNVICYYVAISEQNC